MFFWNWWLSCISLKMILMLMFPFLFLVPLVATSDCSATGVKLYACGVGCDATTSTSSSSTTILIPNSWPSSPVNGHAVLEQLHIRLINTHHTHFCVGASCFVISGAIFFMHEWLVEGINWQYSVKVQGLVEWLHRDTQIEKLTDQ